MINNKKEFIDFAAKKLTPGSLQSYCSSLNKVSKELKLEITRNTVCSEQAINNICIQMLNKGVKSKKISDCRAALNMYMSFIQYGLDDFYDPSELTNSNEYVEGAKKQIIVNSYERDREARNKAIEIHGVNCLVCGMNFESVYGEIGIGFIHIHHLKPLYTIDEEYSVNPEIDLVPVCPNCHAMLHRNKEMLSIEELKNLIQKNKTKL
ncbi:hypothetical protein D0Z62_07820 [Providencia rettgeri]|uniref:HNH endonuclease n=1 Tax=Providencia rettgeri TaxID=587 RepID=UPI00101378EA|nr:HNH endonuclease [Providencia rettgeri]RXN73701.1 hypothetical protein D0Z62_07820 [Providencia rettgeri]